jgi:glycosyltransferase involved in cell wall biosynthesis
MSFGKVFGGKKDIELFIKDRWATPEFKTFVKELSFSLDIQVIHDDSHIEDKEEERKLYGSIDCHVFLNRSSTFALTVAQGMAMQIPTIVMDYSGPRDYCNVLNSCLVKYELQEINELTIEQLTSKGLRNYLFRPTKDFYFKTPKWAQPDNQSLCECLLKVYEEKDYRESIAYQGLVTASSMTWQKSSSILSYIVSKDK